MGLQARRHLASEGGSLQSLFRRDSSYRKSGTPLCPKRGVPTPWSELRPRSLPASPRRKVPQNGSHRRGQNLLPPRRVLFVAQLG